jgi:hypothetical protein
VPLEIGNLGARDEDVLSSLSRRLILLDLNLEHFRGVLDDFGDVCPVTRTNLAKNTLPDPDDATHEPVALQVSEEEKKR